MVTRSVRPWVRAAVLSAATSINVGCYTFAPVESSTVSPNNGATMRVHVTDAGGAALAPLVGPYAGALDGQITDRNDSALVMSVTQLTRRNGVEESWKGERVTIPRAGIASLQQKRFARGRTALFVGGLVAAAAILAVSLSGAGAEGGRGTGGGGGGGEQ